MEESKLGMSSQSRDDDGKRRRQPMGTQPTSPGDEGAAPRPADEHSGLHEIKALATSTKQRISRQSTAHPAPDEALLTTSSSRLAAVALPDPRRTESHPRISVDARPAAVSAPPPGRIGPMILVAVVAAVVAASAAVLVMKNRAPEAASPAPAPATAPVAAPAALPPAEIAPAAPAAPAPVAPETAPAEIPAATPPEALERKAKRDEPKAKRSDKVALTGDAAPESAAPAKASKPAMEEPTDVIAAAAAAKTTKGGDSVDALLDDMVRGKSDEARPAEDRGPRPDKKALDRRDVSTAMGSISEKARACFSVEKVTGTVSVKFSVEPSGEISSAKATGPFAGSPTGACVAQAVKGARFPAYDGSPTSFTFPFLLSE